MWNVQGNQLSFQFLNLNFGKCLLITPHLLCNAFWHKKLRRNFSRACVHRLRSNYAGFCIKCILQEVGSVEGREQSLEMCDLYSAAPNTFVLLRSCISFASLSLSLLSSLPSDAVSPPAATRLVLLHLSQPTTFGAPLPVSLLLRHFSSSVCSLLPPPLFPPSHSPACSACVGVRLQLQSNCIKAILQCANKTTTPRILLFY